MPDYTPWIKLFFLYGKYNVQFANTPLLNEFWDSSTRWQHLIDKNYCVYCDDSHLRYNFTQKFIDEVINAATVSVN